MEGWQREMHEAAEKLKMVTNGSALGSKQRRAEPDISQAPGFEQFCATIGRKIADTVAPLHKRIAELEQRIAEIEGKGIEYRGVYQRAASYPRGSVVTFDGSMHVAIVDVGPNQQPVQSDSWQLCVRAGRDASERRLQTGARSA